VSLDPTGQTLLVSSRLSTITAFDIASRTRLWGFGGKDLDPQPLQAVNDPRDGLARGSHSVSLNASGELLTFDNGAADSEIGRAVIYKVDLKSQTARHVRSFYPPRDACTTNAGGVFCPTWSQGNATFTFDGHVLVNWGDKTGNPNVLSIFDRSGRLLLDLRDESKRTLTYKSEYIPNRFRGKTLVSLDTVLRSTDSRSVDSLVSSPKLFSR
jgi:hypothetical protein